jgi:hypothetical protein
MVNPDVSNAKKWKQKSLGVVGWVVGWIGVLCTAYCTQLIVLCTVTKEWFASNYKFACC